MEGEKEQEPVEKEIEGGGHTWWYVCGECHGAVDYGDKCCRHCGRPFAEQAKSIQQTENGRKPVKWK